MTPDRERALDEAIESIQADPEFQEIMSGLKGALIVSAPEVKVESGMQLTVSDSTDYSVLFAQGAAQGVIGICFLIYTFATFQNFKDIRTVIQVLGEQMIDLRLRAKNIFGHWPVQTFNLRFSGPY